jgi:hypothetical protein
MTFLPESISELLFGKEIHFERDENADCSYGLADERSLRSREARDQSVETGRALIL